MSSNKSKSDSCAYEPEPCDRYASCSNKKLVQMLKGELALRQMNDTAAREKVREAITRLEALDKLCESSIIKALKAELAEKEAKLIEIGKIIMQ